MGRRASGSVVQQPDGKFRVRVSIGGKRIDLPRTDTEAEGWELVAAAGVATEQIPTEMTLALWGSVFLERRALDGVHRGLRQDGARWRGRIASQPWAHIPIRSLGTRTVRQWVSAMVSERLARSTISNALNLLRVALEMAVDAGHVETNVARGVRVPRIPRRPEDGDAWTVMTHAEIAAVTTCTRIPEEARLFYALAIYTGARPCELYGLRWGDVHAGPREQRPRIVVRASRSKPTKTGEVREVPLLEPAQRAVRRLRELLGGRPLPGVLVFPPSTRRMRDGQPRSARETRPDGDDFGWADRTQRDKKRGTWTTYLGHRWFARVRRTVRLYDARHTCASMLISGGWGRAWSIQEVRMMLGHSSIRTTERYAHFAPEGLHAAAAATPAQTRRP
jgi:integrase